MCTLQPGQLVQTGSTRWRWNNLGKMAPVGFSFAYREWEWELYLCLRYWWDNSMSLHSSTSERVTGMMVEMTSLEPPGLPVESTVTLVFSSREPEKQMTRRSRLRRSSRPSGRLIPAQTCSAFRPFSGSMRSLRETLCLWKRR